MTPLLVTSLHSGTFLRWYLSYLSMQVHFFKAFVGRFYCFKVLFFIKNENKKISFYYTFWWNIAFYYLMDTEEQAIKIAYTEKHTAPDWEHWCIFDECTIGEQWIFPSLPNSMTEAFWARVAVNVHTWRLWRKEGNRVSPKRGRGAEDGFIIHGLIGFVAV